MDTIREHCDGLPAQRSEDNTAKDKDAAHMDLSVIIPCKNEAGSLPSLCEELVRTFSSREGLRLELVFVKEVEIGRASCRERV